MWPFSLTNDYILSANTAVVFVVLLIKMIVVIEGVRNVHVFLNTQCVYIYLHLLPTLSTQSV